MSQNAATYVLITPARNEAAYIELTIQSLIKQTIRPLRWVIVSDGSTDGTDEIVQTYAAQHNWIELLRMPDRNRRDFGNKVICFNAGRKQLEHLNYDIIGNLDADISFESDIFAFLLNKFSENPKLGVAGVPFDEGNGVYDFRFSSVQHVSGACQLFRRECFDAVGGYTPLRRGGIDVVTVLSARMKGWQTRTFPEKFCIHHRTINSAKHGGIGARFAFGEKDYSIGRHPLWQIFRAFYQMTRPPLFFGGALLLAGYFWAMMTRVERPLSPELIRFQRQEQMQRLKEFFARKLLLRKSS
jgi:glycosyltransferase involved in cell wall biosynthesis